MVNSPADVEKVSRSGRVIKQKKFEDEKQTPVVSYPSFFAVEFNEEVSVVENHKIRY